MFDPNSVANQRISPNHMANDFSWPLSLEDKITLFYEQTLGWQLDIADQVINGLVTKDGRILRSPIPHSGFASLSIVLSYFEMIAKYRDGFSTNGRSREYFRKGVHQVFKDWDNIAPACADQLLDLLYESARCGLYHAGTISSKIFLGILSRVCVGYSTGILCSLSDWLAAQTSFRQLPSF
jgi:hypothetical protein